MLQGLIEWVAARGLTVIVYYGFQLLALIAVLVFAVWYGNKLNLGVWKSIAIVAIVYPLGDLWKRVLFWIESGFQSFGGENNVRLFIYVPLIAYFVAVLMRIDRKKMCDFLAPCMILTQGVGHWGCIFGGCCQGYPMSWGLYNIDTGLTHFPIQPIEAIGALLIVAYLLYRTKKLNYKPDGLQYPIMLILFGSTRFVFEFFRDNEKIFLGVSSLAFHALFACLIGVFAYIMIVRRKRQKAEQTLGEQ